MAELQFRYSDLKEHIESTIKKSPDRDRLIIYETAILTSLSQKVNRENEDDQRETLDLWNNVNSKSSKRSSFGEHFLQIQDTVIYLYTAFIEKGIFYDIVISQASPAMNIESVTSEVFVGLCTKLTNSILALDGCDICLVYKALEHFDNRKSISINELNNWFTNSSSPIGITKCNMLHNHMHFTCKYYNYENELCSILSNSSYMINALDSLTKIRILIQNNRNHTYNFNGKQA